MFLFSFLVVLVPSFWERTLQGTIGLHRTWIQDADSVADADATARVPGCVEANPKFHGVDIRSEHRESRSAATQQVPSADAVGTAHWSEENVVIRSGPRPFGRAPTSAKQT